MSNRKANVEALLSEHTWDLSLSYTKMKVISVYRNETECVELEMSSTGC